MFGFNSKMSLTFIHIHDIASKYAHVSNDTYICILYRISDIEKKT